jgi:oligopeptide/dipeptide ABC transporter ATP-binding protein
MPLLTVDRLSIEFEVGGRHLPAVSDLSFQVERGELLALVGESGCGKSVTCLSLARLLPEPPARYTSGEIVFHGTDREYRVLRMSAKELRNVRGKRIAYVFQEPSASLNPVMRVGTQIAEAIELHRPGETDVRREVVELLKQVGIPEPAKRAEGYPHEMSGGMQQRVMIAMALASRPDLLVADEPTTALDVTIQAQILELLQKIRSTTGMAVILVTHNLGIVADIAERVIVMYAGHAVESARVGDLVSHPAHPYSVALLGAVPKLGRRAERLNTIPGTVPNPANYPPGCRFFGRCSLAASLPPEKQEPCSSRVPDWTSETEGHEVRCWHAFNSF